MNKAQVKKYISGNNVSEMQPANIFFLTFIILSTHNTFHSMKNLFLHLKFFMNGNPQRNKGPCLFLTVSIIEFKMREDVLVKQKNFYFSVKERLEEKRNWRRKLHSSSQVRIWESMLSPSLLLLENFPASPSAICWWFKHLHV